MNQYHIYEKIGKGKYSTVYKGRRKKTVSYYAIKSVEKSQKARVLQEVSEERNGCNVEAHEELARWGLGKCVLAGPHDACP
jgi:serine/threonine protein kinase